MNMMSDPSLSSEQQQANHDLWKDRYRNAPSMNEGVIGQNSGHGFIKKDDPKAEATLAERAMDHENCKIPQDKERLGLLLHAERAEMGQGQKPAREAMAGLIEYDRNHKHPVADFSRDLKADPYTAHEQRDWFERDGRRKTSDETRQLGDRNSELMFAPAKRAAPNEQEWHIHPTVKEQRGPAPVAGEAPAQKQELTGSLAQKIEQRRGRHP